MLDWNFGSSGFNPQHFVNQAQSYRPGIPALRGMRRSSRSSWTEGVGGWSPVHVELGRCGMGALGGLGSPIPSRSSSLCLWSTAESAPGSWHCPDLLHVSVG